MDRAATPHHECSPERLVDYQMFHLRGEVAHLETGMRRFLATSAGRFEAWLAARHVRGDA